MRDGSGAADAIGDKNHSQFDVEKGILDNMITGLRRIDGELSPQQNLAAVNPNFGMGAKGYTYNCGNSAVTNELRRKGYDVEALPDNGSGMLIEELAEMFDGATVQMASHLSTTNATREMISKVEQSILIWGEGARGAIRGEWTGENTGHLFSFEARKGKVMYDDGQSGEEDVNYLEDMKPQSIKYVRLDNLNPNNNVLMSVKNREC